MKGSEDVFCDRYGYTNRNRVISYFLAGCDLDFAINDVAEDEGLLKSKVREIIQDLEIEEILKKSRKVKGVQLYKLNHTSSEAMRLLEAFNECLSRQFRDIEYKNKNLFLNKGDALIIQKIIKKYNKESNEYLTFKVLSKLIKKRLTDKRLKETINFLEDKGRIGISKGYIIWLYAPKKELNKLLKNGIPYEIIKNKTIRTMSKQL